MEQTSTKINWCRYVHNTWLFSLFLVHPPKILTAQRSGWSLDSPPMDQSLPTEAQASVSLEQPKERNTWSNTAYNPPETTMVANNPTARTSKHLCTRSSASCGCKQEMRRMWPTSEYLPTEFILHCSETKSTFIRKAWVGLRRITIGGELIAIPMRMMGIYDSSIMWGSGEL